MTTRLTFSLLALVALLAAPSARAAQTPPMPAKQVEVLPHLGPVEDELPLTPPPIADAATFQDALDGTVPISAASYAAYAGGSEPADSGYGLHLMPQGLIYRSYLAGAKESRFRSVWNHEQGNGNIWDITLGGNVGILRYGTRGDGRPEGIQLGIEGAGQVRLDIDEDRDVDASDFRFGVPLTWGDSIYQVKLAYYHLSSHVGDEYMLKNQSFERFNYSRDVLVWGHSLYPTDDFRIYGEIGYAFYSDVSDPWEGQFGIDWCPNGRTGASGAPFAAFNGHLREEVDWGGNFVAQAGWCWRRSPATGLFRLGVEHYNGKDDQFSFFNQSVSKTGFGMWYDY